MNCAKHKEVPNPSPQIPRPRCLNQSPKPDSSISLPNYDVYNRRNRPLMEDIDVSGISTMYVMITSLNGRLGKRQRSTDRLCSSMTNSHPSKSKGFNNSTAHPRLPPVLGGMRIAHSFSRGLRNHYCLISWNWWVS